MLTIMRFKREISAVKGSIFLALASLPAHWWEEDPNRFELHR
jgi:hypothetical protein